MKKTSYVAFCLKGVRKKLLGWLGVLAPEPGYSTVHPMVAGFVGGAETNIYLDQTQQKKNRKQKQQNFKTERRINGVCEDRIEHPNDAKASKKNFDGDAQERKSGAV